MKFKAVFLDFDDTIGNRDAYSYPHYYKLIRSCADTEDPMEIEAIVQDMMIWDQLGTTSKSYLQKKLEEKYHLNLPFTDMNEWWKTCFYESVELYQQAIPVLEQLKQEGYILGIITNGFSPVQHNKLEVSGVLDIVDDAIVSGDYSFNKPDRRIFEEAMHRLDVTPEQSVMVGDIFTTDIIGAYRAGMKPIWIQSRKQRPCMADLTIIRNISELPEALKKLNA